MRKKISGRQLSRGQGARKALFRSLIVSMLVHGKIKTTMAKAKSVQADIDKLITKAKKDSVSARRAILAKLGNDRNALMVLIEQIVPSVSGRNSGYTRIVKLPNRRGDAAAVVILEFVDKIVKKEPEKEEKKSTKAKEKKVKPAKKQTKEKSK